MIKFVLSFGILGLVIYSLIAHTPPSSEKKLFARIENFSQPTAHDYHLIQKYLESASHRFEKLKDYQKSAIAFKLIGDQKPERGRVFVNCDENARENCVILYASFNKNYPRALRHLLDFITQSDYKGHVLYRIGGWPNTEQGDLSLSCVPYAFKPCLFKEAQNLGYEKILWLDVSITPLFSLNEQFSQIGEKGYLAVGNVHTVGPFFNEDAAKSFQISLEEAHAIPSISAGIFGLDLTQEKPRQALELWYAAAHDPHAFFSARPEQNALSIILHRLDMTEWVPITRVVEKKEHITSDSLYLVDRKLSHKGRKKSMRA